MSENNVSKELFVRTAKHFLVFFFLSVLMLFNMLLYVAKPTMGTLIYASVALLLLAIASVISYLALSAEI